MFQEMRVCISSPPDRRELVAEILFDDEQWAELNQEDGTLTLEVYPKHSGSHWQLSFDQVIQGLTEAREKLVGSQRLSES
jgi:hypothetical protein